MELPVIKDVEQNFNEYYDFFSKSFRFYFHPQKQLEILKVSKTKTIIVDMLLLAFMSSVIMSVLMGIREFDNGFRGLTSIPSIFLLLLSTSFLLFLVFFSSLSFTKNNVSKKLLISYYFAVYYYSILMLPCNIIWMLFLITENYFFYFLSYLFLPWGFFYMFIYVPLKINVGIRRLTAVLLTIIVFALVFFLSFTIADKLSFNDDFINEFGIGDPIMEEFINKEVLDNSRLDYLIQSSTIINNALKKYANDRSLEELVYAKQSIENVVKSKSVYISLMRSLRFRTNKKIFGLAIEYINNVAEMKQEIESLESSSSVLTNINIQEELEKSREVSERIAKEKAAVKFSNVKVQTKKYNELNLILEQNNRRLENILMWVKVRNSSIKKLGDLEEKSSEINKKLITAIKDKQNWIQFKRKIMFLP